MKQLIKDNINSNRNSISILEKVSKVLFRSETLILLGIILLFVFVSLRVPTFKSFDNIIAIMKYMAFLGILTVPVTFLLISKRFDLSIGMSTSLIGIIMGLLIRDYDLSIPLVLLVGFIISIAIGSLNGFLTINMKINALIATIGTMFMFKGLSWVISKRYSITGITEKVSGLNEVIFNVPVGLFVLLIIAIIGIVLLSFSKFGRSIYAIGKDENASRLAGIPVSIYRYIIYIFSAFCCYIVAFLAIVNFKSFPSSTGNEWEFLVHAGCILGGCSIYGGRGTIPGGILGVMFMITIESSLRALGVSAYYQTVLVGVILILAVLIDTLRYKRLQKLKS